MNTTVSLGRYRSRSRQVSGSYK